MGKIIKTLAELSLRKSIILYITIFTVIALLLSGITVGICSHEAQVVRNRYATTGHIYYLTDENGNRLGNGQYIGTSSGTLSKRDEILVAALEVIPILATPIYTALCILAAAFLFYRNKLEKPLLELKEASVKISENDLNFRLSYDTMDEMGKLCSSFETMRSMLAANFSEMWSQIEDRRKLNAAFAHELRTPLTVLKGYDEMLQISPDKKTKDIAATMGKHIRRMEYYVTSMSNLRRLEDMQLDRAAICTKELVSALRDNTLMECKAHGKTLSFQDKTYSQTLEADRSCIIQVSNNLVANAVRYAVSDVVFCIEEKEGGLLLGVIDDGKGFSDDGLHKASEPYYSEEKDAEEHFGIGLYLCRMLCERHGGWLKVENLQSGAKVSVFFKNYKK